MIIRLRQFFCINMRVLISLCFLSIVYTQTVININVELSETSLRLYYENESVDCTLQDAKRLSILCPNAMYIPKNDTKNIQLPLPLNVIRIPYNHSEVYISEIEYDDYFCMIEHNLANTSCTRVMIHYSEMEKCFVELLNDNEPILPHVDDCVASTYKHELSTQKMTYDTIDLFIACFVFAVLLNLFIAFVIYLYIVIATSLNNVRNRRKYSAFLRKTYLPIKRDDD